MRKIQKLFFVAWTACILPTAAHAQDGGYFIPEHDWRLSIGGTSYGLLQTTWSTRPTRTTTICLGHYTFNTHLPAAGVAAMFLLPTGVLGFLLLRGLSFRKPVS